MFFVPTDDGRIVYVGGIAPPARTTGVRKFTCTLALAAPIGFDERLIRFWSNHFAVSVDKRQALLYAAPMGLANPTAVTDGRVTEPKLRPAGLDTAIAGLTSALIVICAWAADVTPSNPTAPSAIARML